MSLNFRDDIGLVLREFGAYNIYIYPAFYQLFKLLALMKLYGEQCSDRILVTIIDCKMIGIWVTTWLSLWLRCIRRPMINSSIVSHIIKAVVVDWVMEINNLFVLHWLHSFIEHIWDLVEREIKILGIVDLRYRITSKDVYQISETISFEDFQKQKQIKWTNKSK